MANDEDVKEPDAPAELESAGSDSSIHDRINRIEANLIAQDHRAIPVLRTFFAERKQWSRSDPRWAASWTAFLWWCLGSVTSPTGAAVGLAAFLTLALTGWNAWEFRRQNEALSEQNATLKRQVDQQEADSRIARRAQLLATIYEEDCTAPPEKICVPRSHIRARQEAALAFFEIERRRGVSPDLSGANLSDANLSGVNLSDSILQGAFLRGANLNGADLSGANLSNAFLRGANLRGVDLSDADLNDADLSDANLSDANLSDADLSGTYSRQEQFNAANGNSRTRIPNRFSRPKHWKDEPDGTE